MINIATYVISDTHFDHEKILEFTNRPFKTVGEMDNTLIENWNNIITNDDTVIHCGDFAFGGSEEIRNYASQLNGNIILIRGNHDRKGIKFFEDCGFEVSREKVSKKQYIYTLGIVKDNEIHRYILSHAPLPDNLIPDEFINMHGHLHDYPLSDKFDKSKHRCVSVECIDYKPLRLDKKVNKNNRKGEENNMNLSKGTKIRQIKAYGFLYHKNEEFEIYSNNGEIIEIKNCERDSRFAIKSNEFDTYFRVVEDENNNEKEYAIQEVFNDFPEGTLFDCFGYTCKVSNNSLYYSNDDFWEEVTIYKKWINAKFKLIKQDKQVDFMEALRLFHEECKDIYCVHNENKILYKYNEEGYLEDSTEISVRDEEILFGKWYVVE